MRDATSRKDHGKRDENVATYVRTNNTNTTNERTRRTNVPTTSGAAAPKRGPRGATRGFGNLVVKAVLDWCKAHAVPEPDAIAKSALGQQALNLAKGGYDERDIRETALELASKFTLYVRHK